MPETDSQRRLRDKRRRDAQVDRDRLDHAHAAEHEHEMMAATLEAAKAKVGAEQPDLTDAEREVAIASTFARLLSAPDPVDSDAPTGGRQLRVTRGSDVRMQTISWWEPDWIPSAALTLLAGREGLGKSTIACHWCARETRAGNYTVYLHTEDSREHTVAPRLKAAGADMDKVLFIDVETETTDEGSVVLPLDTDRLDDLLAQYRVTFVVLDAATSAMHSSLSGKDDRQVRQYLEPLSRLAAKHNAVFLGLVHFGKRDGADSGKLILGSIAWSQVARSVLSVAQDPDSGTLVVTNTKGNLAPRTRSVEARIVSTPVRIGDEQTDVGVIEWMGETTADARDFLAGDGQDGGDDRSEAERWLEDYLTENGSMPSTDAKRDAIKALGCSKETIGRAAKKLGVRQESRGFPRKTYWSLPNVVEGEVVTDLLSDVNDDPHARHRDATDATGSDQCKRNDATAEISQSRHARESDATGDTTALHLVPLSPSTCRQWFDDHVHRLLAEGASTAHSAAVYAAGEAAGWKIDNLRKVASKSPLVAVAERRPDGYLWNIGENAQATVVTADQWLTGFLTGRGWVKASEVYAAAAAAGWTRDAIKSAALADHIAKRGASIATEWNLTREQESA